MWTRVAPSSPQFKKTISRDPTFCGVVGVKPLLAQGLRTFKNLRRQIRHLVMRPVEQGDPETPGLLRANVSWSMLSPNGMLSMLILLVDE